MNTFRRGPVDFPLTSIAKTIAISKIKVLQFAEVIVNNNLKSFNKFINRY